MSKNTFKNYICKPHCVFFKDGEKEEMACYGAVIAQRVVTYKNLSPPRVDQEPEKKDTRFQHDADLIRMVCANCPFEADDCDFRSSSPPPNPVPCGGYIFLYRQKSTGVITVNDLIEVCDV